MPRLLYVPVSNSNRSRLNTTHPYVLFNPLRQSTRILSESVKLYTEPFGDSGGFQYFKYSQAKYKNKYRITTNFDEEHKMGQNKINFNPIDLCCKYGQIGIKYGFTLDNPFYEDEGEKVFYEKLAESYRFAKLMFKNRQNLCPNTKLIIPLQYGSKKQLYTYYKTMSSLHPDGYALPMWGYNFDKENSIAFACALSFLHHNKVKFLHMLGNSSQELMIIGAAAVGLKMFEQLSFDSGSFDQLNYGRIKYMDHNTMRYVDLKKSGVSELIAIPKDGIKISKEEREEVAVRNAFTLANYTQQISMKAQNIEALKEHIKENKYLKRKSEIINCSIRVLERAVSDGYEFVENWKKHTWK